MISVYDYLDYREYLREYYRDKKRNQPFFSYRYIGSRVGMDSSYVIKVLQGALHISRAKIERFCRLCGLGGQEADYFETLVLFNKATGDKERKLYFERLFAVSRTRTRRLEPFQYEFFQKWYYSAVWALISCRPFRGGYGRLARLCSPEITAAQARDAVRLLKRLGLVTRGPGRALTVTDKNITTGEKWHSSAITRYQQEMIARAGESLARFPKPERDISTVTVTIPQAALDEIRGIIAEFRRTVINLADSMKDSDRVFQLNVQLFPLSARVTQSHA